MDLVIRNGTVIDGTGRSAFNGDIGVKDGRIAAIGKVPDKAREEIDAGGSAVAPGFIDVHTHFDAQVFWDPMLSPSVYHGVTTALAGNCGFTLAPLSGDPEDADYLLRMLSRVEGMPLSTLRDVIKPDWTSFGGYLDKLDGKLAINTAFMVGHSALRRAVMGERSVTDHASEAELKKMSDLLRRSLAEGGTGFSTTISTTHSDFEGRPVPSRVATREELVSLAGIVGDYPGTWLEMVFGVESMEEEQCALATDMARSAKRPLNWNAILINSKKPESLQSKLDISDYARARGATVFGLVPARPMTNLLNFVNCFVIDTIPGWSQLVTMSLAQRRAALGDPAIRAELKAGAQTAGVGPAARVWNWPTSVLAGLSLPQNVRWNGRTLGEVAEATGRDVFDTLFDLAVEENLGVSFYRNAESTDELSWSIRQKLWRDDRCLIGGSDAGAHLDMINTFAFSTQLLGEGVRRRKLLALEEAVYRITGLPAQRFGLTGRGRIEIGAAADIVTFDPDTIDCGPIAMRSDLPQNEKRLYADAIGVHHVIVGGVPVAHENQPTGRLGGKVLRSGRDTQTVAFGG